MSLQQKSISYVASQQRTNQTGTATFGGNTVTVKWEDGLTGTSNPGWKTKLQKGISTVGTYDAYQKTITLGQTLCSTQYRSKTNPNVFSNWVFQGLPSAPTFGSSTATSDQKNQADADAQAEFYRNVQSVYAEFQAIVAAGEAKSTLQLFVSTAMAIRRLSTSAKRDMEQLRKRYKRDPKLLYQHLRSRYLEWTFGVMPLVSDLESFTKAMDSDQGPTAMVAGSGRHQTSNTSTTLVNGFSNSQCPLTYTLRSSFEYSVKYTAKVKLGVVKQGKFVPKRGFGTNLREFIPSAYNLIPWSFVVDYVSNLGTHITARCYSNIGLVYAYKNTRSVNTREASWSPRINTNIDSASGGFSYTSTSKTISRGKVDAVPVPPLKLEVPGLRQLFNMMLLFKKKL